MVAKEGPRIGHWSAWGWTGGAPTAGSNEGGEGTLPIPRLNSHLLPGDQNWKNLELLRIAERTANEGKLFDQATFEFPNPMCGDPEIRIDSPKSNTSAPLRSPYPSAAVRPRPPPPSRPRRSM